MTILPQGVSMKPEKRFRAWVVWLTAMVALGFSTVPLPSPFDLARPQFLALVVIYWVIAFPTQVGVITAWCFGLALDVLHGVVMGQNALAMAVVAYLSFMLHLRIRVFPAWQQCIVVCLLVGVYRLVSVLIRSALGASSAGFIDYLPAFSSALIWPWVYLLLRYLQRRYARL